MALRYLKFLSHIKKIALHREVRVQKNPTFPTFLIFEGVFCTFSFLLNANFLLWLKILGHLKAIHIPQL